MDDSGACVWNRLAPEDCQFQLRARLWVRLVSATMELQQYMADLMLGPGVRIV